MQAQWISVKVHLNAGKEVLVETGPGRYEAWVRAKPVQGRANEAVTNLLVRSLRIAAGQLHLVKGRSGRQKLFKIVT